MLTKIFPFLDWFKGYGGSALRADALAGLTVALVLIPQSMAYAQLAGMPAYYGLYAALLPPMIAALFGSSRQLATGPVAVVSLMTAASLAPLATQGSEHYIAYAILLALLVGVFQLLLGVLKLGLVVNFLSHPVVGGFTNAAAIIIATSQLSKMFGVSVDTAEHHYETIMAVVSSAINYTHWPTFLMGALAFALMFGLKKTMPKIPGVLVAVALTTLISWAFGFNHDTRAPLSSVQSSEAVELVQRFNTAVTSVTPLAEKRTMLNAQLDQAQASGDGLLVLDVKHQLDVLAVEMTRLQEEAHLHRESLRLMLFEGVDQGSGLSFYPKGEVPAGLSGDGRTWRIRVGNRPIDERGLLMTGGGAIVGSIPSGLPDFSIPALDIPVILKLFPYAAIIALLGFMEAISIAKAMAAKTGQRLDPNQELIGQGMANILGSIGQSYPASGSFSRSAVNLQAGAQTGFSSVFTSLAVLVVLFFFTPLLYHLPQSVLAAVIMMAVIGLINVSGIVHAWKAQWYDGVIALISFLCTLAFAPHLDKGIMVGVALSLAVFLYKSMRPTVTSLSRTEDQALRSAGLHGLKECAYIDLIRFDGPLFFANASFLEDQITSRMSAKKDLRHIIIAASGIADMDASGEETLSLLVDRVRSAGIDISLSGVNESVMKVLERTHLIEKIGRDHVYPTMDRAVCSVHAEAHRDSREENCPLTNVCRLA
ncbi:sulfate transporter [Alkalidesulfovibrio alkalitolerans DSM 16529]|uniref:Sulfate transporter n=1 Tax=Alkalidesulfovibrio alkalitolerans DSM 16529 TaxID=1121439 RepID=S7UR62_9BACT|nr:SulP family inorganic anion transporter [Alkalidesulfovibrio alkalitolerans]EPR34753.1 sulfate transporter [Alkalidesulfovibrio alkalitolerans DSM 16529]